ncbi:MAG: NifU family protein [Proteobacteria bacterium]|nr:NifU family protein [Pseudomonadota bacterium]
MFIATETTADPATIRFLPGRSVTGSGTADFADAESAKRSPLAERLFAIDAVAAVSLGADFITVTKTDEADWRDLKAAVLAAIMEHFVEGKPALLAAAAAESPGEAGEDSEVVAQIKELIETRIAPGVAQSGGKIAFRGFEDGIVLLDIEGPAVGLKDGIANMLQHYVPEVTGVRPYEEYTRLQKAELNTPVALEVRKLLDEQINPGVASHGGHIALIDVKDDTVFIRLEGGCQGCGMADVTLKQGIEQTIRQTVPSITAVLDVTDHAGGSNPYYQPGKGGVSPF